MDFDHLVTGWHSVRDYIQCHRIVLLTLLLTALVGYFSLRFFGPSIPKISVPLPAQAQPDWKGEVLQNPCIQGQDPSLIQCYCPATGQLIGTVKAATTTDVDNAIEKAKAAQLKWRETTFKQRALVLRTLLKFILENQGTLNSSKPLTLIRRNRPRLL